MAAPEWFRDRGIPVCLNPKPRKPPRPVKPHEAFYYFVLAPAYAAKRMLGAPTTPLFSITVFISFEPNHVRAFDTSATSWRISTSFGSSALRNTRPLVMPAVARSFSCPL
jgi:hypothetical protein